MKDRHPARRILITAAALVVFQLYSPAAADAAILPHSNLQDLVQRATTVFVGTCVSVSPGVTRFDDVGQLGYTEYTFMVHDWIKGTQGQAGVIVFRQPRHLSERIRGADLSLSLRTSGDALLRPAAYVAGNEYLLFLHAANKWGLTAPVGSVQGAFQIRRGPNGELEAVNGIDNLGLFKDVPASGGRLEAHLGGRDRELLRQGRGPVSLEALLPITRRLAGIPSSR
jgi:hypothetical protein